MHFANLLNVLQPELKPRCYNILYIICVVRKVRISKLLAQTYARSNAMSALSAESVRIWVCSSIRDNGKVCMQSLGPEGRSWRCKSAACVECGFIGLRVCYIIYMWGGCLCEREPPRDTLGARRSLSLWSGTLIHTQLCNICITNAEIIHSVIVPPVRCSGLYVYVRDTRIHYAARDLI